MGSLVSRTALRGLLIMDPRLSPDALLPIYSTYTQADPRAGIPVATVATSLVLSASGPQTAGTTLYLQTLDSGLALDSSYCWRLGTSGDWYGWEPPTTMASWEAVTWGDGTGIGVRSALYPHALRSSLGTPLIVAQVEYRVGLTSTYQVRCYRWTAGAWASVSVHSSSTAPTDGLYPALCLLDSGRLLCASWVERGDTAQVRVDYSDDDGLTWTMATSHALRSAIDTSSSPGAGNPGYALGRIRWVQGRGQVLMCLGIVKNNTAGPVVRDRTVQLCSTDDGLHFSEIEEVAALGYSSVWFDLVFDGQTFIYAAVPIMASPRARIWRLASAETPISSMSYANVATIGEEWGTPAATQTLVDSDITLVRSEQGRLYLYGRATAPTPPYSGQGIAHYSDDGGTTWTPFLRSRIASCAMAAWWYSGDGSTHPKNIAAIWHHGRVMLAHNWAANPGDEDDSLGLMWLGGSTTICLPDGWEQRSGGWERTVSWSLTYLPFDLPGDCGWTATGAGAESLALGRLALDSSAAAIWYYQTLAPSPTVEEGIIAEAQLRPNTGGSDLVNDVELRLRYGDGTAWYQVAIYFGSGGLGVWEETGATQIGGYVGDLTDGVEVRIAMAGGQCSAWYRLPTAPGDDARAWVELCSATAIPDGGAGVATSRIEWGHRSGAAATSSWYRVCSVDGADAGQQLAGGQVNPSGLLGRPYSCLPEYLSEGVSVAAEAGPTMAGDIMSIATSYGYAIDHIFPSVAPSPRIEWRSTDTTQQTIAMGLGSAITADTSPGNDIIGVWLQGINYREVRLQGLTSSTLVWSTLGTIYADTGLSGLHYTRAGNTIIPTGTAGTNEPYIHVDEFAGGYFCHDSGLVRLILHNTEGQFGTGHKRPTLILDGTVGTDDASGTAGSIRPPWVCGLVKLSGADYSAYRLLIPAQTTYEGYYRIGTMLIGWVEIIGADYSWGRRVAMEGNRDTVESSDWISSTRSLAPSRRIVEIGWTDGVDSTGSYSGDPDYVVAQAAGVAVASTRDTISQVEGLLRSLAGPGHVVAYLPVIPVQSGTVALNRRWQGVMGEVISDMSMETVLGEEGSTELSRLPSVVIREVV